MAIISISYDHIVPTSVLAEISEHSDIATSKSNVARHTDSQTIRQVVNKPKMYPDDLKSLSKMSVIIPNCTGKLCACNYGIYGRSKLKQVVSL